MAIFITNLTARSLHFRRQQVADGVISLDCFMACCRLIGRELEKWVPDEVPGMVSLDDLALEDSRGFSRGWDQFAVNENMYGVQTTFDEGFYTTELKKGGSKISEEEAARIAREIERGQMGVTNRHVAEERGLTVDDSGVSTTPSSC